jgi:hypothetical protein
MMVEPCRVRARSTVIMSRAYRVTGRPVVSLKVLEARQAECVVSGAGARRLHGLRVSPQRQTPAGDGNVRARQVGLEPKWLPVADAKNLKQ